MRMDARRIAIALVSLAIAGVLLMMFVERSPAAEAPPAKVDFTMKARMPSLADPKNIDHFEITMTDAQIRTAIQFDCTAGRTEMYFVEKNKTCTFPAGGKAAGSIAAPGGTWVPRTQFGGFYAVGSDGTTPVSTLNITYLPVGKVPAGQSNFSGALKLKPKLTSGGATALKETILARLAGETAGGPLNKAVDSIDLNQFCIPSLGRPSDTGVCITGTLVFPYQNYSWYQKLSVTFKDKTYELVGNMPYVDAVDASGAPVTDPKYLSVTEYNATLTVPTAAATGDDALFVSTDDDADLFSAVDGISCKITMKNNNEVPIVVQGEATTGFTDIDATGSCTGTNIPLEVVRAYMLFIALNPTTFFGA